MLLPTLTEGLPPQFFSLCMPKLLNTFIKILCNQIKILTILKYIKSDIQLHTRNTERFCYDIDIVIVVTFRLLLIYDSTTYIWHLYKTFHQQPCVYLQRKQLYTVLIVTRSLDISTNLQRNGILVAFCVLTATLRRLKNSF